MVEIRFKHVQMKVSPDGVANNRGDPPRLFGARGDPSSGGKRAPTMVSNALPENHPLLPIKNRDRLSALASLRATVGSAAICRPIGNNNNKMKKDCVRLDDSPEVSLADFRCEGVSRGREGFHRAPTMVATEMLWRTTAKRAVQFQKMGYI